MSKCNTVLHTEKDLFEREIRPNRPKITTFRPFLRLLRFPNTFGHRPVKQSELIPFLWFCSWTSDPSLTYVLLSGVDRIYLNNMCFDVYQYCLSKLHFRLLNRFQISLTRVFEQFLSTIVFSPTAEIHEDLISRLIGLSGLWRDDQYHVITSDVNLFLGSKLHPSPGLLCIIFGHLLRLGFVL